MRTLVLLALIMGCSSLPKVDYKKTRALLEVIKVQKIVTHPGHVRLVSLPADAGFVKPALLCGDTRYDLYTAQGQLKTYLAESYFSNRRPYDCFFETEIDGAKFVKKAFRVKIKRYKYKSGRLYVDKKKIWLSDKDLKRAIGEKKALKEVYRNAIKDGVLFDGKFIVPLKAKITSYYGTKRVYNNHKKSPHLGTDFRAAVGVPIPVANRGKVVHVKDLFFSGKTVIVDHGLGVFTTYSHLSELRAKVGDIVEKGTIIGLAGKTGRVSGPHLHWGVKIHGHWVSGFSLIEEGI